MIKLQKMTPSVYYDQSRDFQFIGRLYDIVLNSAKTNAELIQGLPLNEDIDNKLLDLLTLTLGFKSLHEYNIIQLKAICGVFAELLRNKGNVQALKKACTALLNAEGITEEVIIGDIDYDTNSITIYIPEGITDINLLKDLFNYILPAGMTCNIVKTLLVSENAATEVSVDDTVKYTMEYADRNAGLIENMLDTDAADTNINKIYNIPGVALNSTTIGQSNMCKVNLETDGNGTAEFTTGRIWYTVGEPIKITTDKSLVSVWARIKDGNLEPVNYEKLADKLYVVNLTKSTGWWERGWKAGNSITILVKFE